MPRRLSMICHRVRFALKPEAPNDQAEAALELLRRKGRELDVFEFFCVGRDFGGAFTIGALYVLKDIKAYETYMNAPLHLQVDRVGLPLVSNMGLAGSHRR
jgi:Stress responsive A/B Barrel Domain